MQITGKEISAIFRDELNRDACEALTSKLLTLMSSVPANDDTVACRFMILGALTAVGHETRE
jgi:hypothetical protein